VNQNVGLFDGLTVKDRLETRIAREDFDPACCHGQLVK
jgi:hypothetical protein